MNDKKKFLLNKKPQAVIFDLDGTLLNSMPYHVLGWRQALNEKGINIPEKFLYLNEGSLDCDFLIPFSQKYDCKSSRQEFFATIFKRQIELYNKLYAAKVKLYQKSEILIEEIKSKNIKLALVTSSNKTVLQPWLKKWLSKNFAVIITGDMVKNFKPHPEPYLKAIELLEIEPSEILAIENAPAGVKSALAAGLFTLALCTTLNKVHFKNLVPVFENHTDLLNYFKNNAY